MGAIHSSKPFYTVDKRGISVNGEAKWVYVILRYTPPKGRGRVILTYASEATAGGVAQRLNADNAEELGDWNT